MSEFDQYLTELVDVVRERYEMQNEETDISTPTKILELFAKAGTLMDLIEPELKEKLVIDKGRFKIEDDKVWYFDLEFPARYLLPNCFN